MSILRQHNPAKQDAGHDDKMQLHGVIISKCLLMVDLHGSVAWKREVVGGRKGVGWRGWDGGGGWEFHMGSSWT